MQYYNVNKNFILLFQNLLSMPQVFSFTYHAIYQLQQLVINQFRNIIKSRNNWYWSIWVCYTYEWFSLRGNRYRIDALNFEFICIGKMNHTTYNLCIYYEYFSLRFKKRNSKRCYKPKSNIIFNVTFMIDLYCVLLHISIEKMDAWSVKIF